MVIDHIGIVVRCIDEGIDLWGKAFGYAPITSPVINSRQQVRVVFLGKAGSAMIKLVEPVGPTSGVNAFAARGGGLHHLCFRCPDMDSELSRIQELGGRVLIAPQPGEAFENELIAFAYAGQGLNVELIETCTKAGLLPG
jgi:methylmalonyl-CoA/ethylmalonyl-CoA epimerase